MHVASYVTTKILLVVLIIHFSAAIANHVRDNLPSSTATGNVHVIII